MINTKLRKTRDNSEKNSSRLSFVNIRNLIYPNTKINTHDKDNPEAQNELSLKKDFMPMNMLKSTEFSHHNIDQLEGKLFHRIISWSSKSNKKQTFKKSWENVYCIMTFGLMLIYKNPADAQNKPKNPIYSWDLYECFCFNVGTYKNKDNVFGIKEKSGQYEVFFQVLLLKILVLTFFLGQKYK